MVGECLLSNNCPPKPPQPKRRRIEAQPTRPPSLQPISILESPPSTAPPDASNGYKRRKAGTEGLSAVLTQEMNSSIGIFNSAVEETSLLVGPWKGKDEFTYTELSTSAFCKTCSKESDREAYHKLQHECKILQQLRHEHIVALREVQEDDDSLTIIMQQVSGFSLRVHIERKGGRLPIVQAWHLFRQVCWAVAYMHRLHFYHQDLSLDNIWVEQPALIRLGGFGSTLDATADGLTQQERKIAAAIDVKTLGILLLTMFLGPANASEEVLQRGRYMRHPFWLEAGLHNDSELVCLLAEMLCPDSVQRITMDRVVIHPWVATRPYILSQRSPSTSISSTVPSTLPPSSFQTKRPDLPPHSSAILTSVDVDHFQTTPPLHSSFNFSSSTSFSSTTQQSRQSSEYPSFEPRLWSFPSSTSGATTNSPWPSHFSAAYGCGSGSSDGIGGELLSPPPYSYASTFLSFSFLAAPTRRPTSMSFTESLNIYAPLDQTSPVGGRVQSPSSSFPPMSSPRTGVIALHYQLNQQQL